YCLASFLSWFIVGVRIPEKVEVSIIFFIIICLYLQSVILFTVCVKLILKSIDLIFENFFKKNNYRNRKSSHISYFISNIKPKRLKKEKKLYIESIISIIGIATLPTISFFIIYGTTNSITHLPDEFPGVLKWEYLYYSISVSYPLPNDEVISFIQNESNWVKVVSSMQAIVQKLIEIFLLGSIATLIINYAQKRAD